MPPTGPRFRLISSIEKQKRYGNLYCPVAKLYKRDSARVYATLQQKVATKRPALYPMHDINKLGYAALPYVQIRFAKSLTFLSNSLLVIFVVGVKKGFNSTLRNNS